MESRSNFKKENSICKCNKPNLTFEMKVDFLELIESDNIYLKITKKDCEIRRDIDVKLKKFSRITGTVYNGSKVPVENVIVNLIKYENSLGVLERKVVNYTITDEFGAFYFFIDKNLEMDGYKIEIDNIINV